MIIIYDYYYDYQKKDLYLILTQKLATDVGKADIRKLKIAKLWT